MHSSIYKGVGCVSVWICAVRKKGIRVCASEICLFMGMGVYDKICLNDCVKDGVWENYSLTL